MKFDYKLEVFNSTKQTYQTKIYSKVKESIFLQKNIPQKSHEDTLEWFFNQDHRIPLREKKSIEEIHVYPEMRIFVLFSGKHKIMFNNLEYIAEKTGWYFYITGLRLKKDEITEYIDSFCIKNKEISIDWEFSDDIDILLDPIATDLNQNAYLLKIIDQKNENARYLLLDAGLEEDDLKKLQSQTNHIDLIFISHAHKDHTSGLLSLKKTYPKAPIICSRTTLEFYLLASNFSKNRNKFFVECNLYEKLYFIKNEEQIHINSKCFIKFFHAGHMPGALMLLLKIGNFKFLYTGDFSYYDYFPIAGVSSTIDSVPQNINFLLVDGTSSSSEYDAPSYLFSNLKRVLNVKARYKNKVLIGADYGSTAMVMFFTIFRFFRQMQRRHGFDAVRPRIYLTTKIRRYFQIMTHNKEDLHPYFKNLILKEHNPFQSAIIKWIYSYRDLMEALSEKGGIFILEPADLHYGWIQEAFKVIAQNKYNLIFLSGALRDPGAIELCSGNDKIKLKYSKTGNYFQVINKAQIWNRKYPNLVLNLHGDKYQLEKLLEKLNPSKICFFQQDPRKLVGIRNFLREKLTNISTLAIYRYQEGNILLYSDSKKYNIKIKS